MKQLCYALLYGLGKRKLAQSLHVDQEQAQRMAAQFRASIPTLVRPVHALVCRACKGAGH